MNDSRTICKYLKKADKETYVNIEFLDKLTPNTFDLTKNGRIQSSSFGSFSSILVKINVLNTKDNKYNEVEYALHPDRLGLICSRILESKLKKFQEQNKKMPEYLGEVHKTIYTNKVNGTKFDCAIFNLKYEEETDDFVIFIKIGEGDLVKDETNRNDFTNFEKKNLIGIKIPYEEMELLCYQLDKYLDVYRFVMSTSMFKGRTSYETKCKTIFKNCKGDAKKIREITEKFNKLSDLEKQDVLVGKKQMEQ